MTFQLLPVKPTIKITGLEKIDVRVGTIKKVEDVKGSDKMKRASVTILAIAIFAIIGVGAVYISARQPTNKPVPTPIPTVVPTKKPEMIVCAQDVEQCADGSYVRRTAPKCEFMKCPETIPAAKTGWKTYKNYALCFEISFPDKYKITDDKYGWPNSVILLYAGGQSYDLPIEIWNSVAEYQAKYKNQPNLVVKQINNRFITLLNTNFVPEVDDIIATFQTL